MKLGDRIKLHIEAHSSFGDTKITDGEFIVIGISKALPHCFGDSMWSEGFNSFEYGEQENGRPDIVRRGAIYVTQPEELDEKSMSYMHYDKKVVSWEVLPQSDKKEEQKT